MPAASTSYEPLSQNEEVPMTETSHGHRLGLDSRPPTYYGEGIFSPPSSASGEEEEDDDEGRFEAKERLLEKRRNMLRHNTALAVDEEADLHPDYLPPYEGGGMGDARGKLRSPLRYLLLAITGLIVFAGIIGILAAYSYDGRTFRASGKKPLTMDHMFNGTFNVERYSVNWVAEAGDGIFSKEDGGNIVLHDIKTNTSKLLVDRHAVKDEHGYPLSWNQWKLSPDMEYLLIKTDSRKQWRHSSLGNYYIYSLATQTTVSLIPPSNSPKTAYATWSPTGQTIAFVHSNDVYVLPSPGSEVIRVTSNGNSSLFNGVPDWVYEEEVFGTDFALWWSPDSAKLAFLRLDETNVDTYTFPIYNPTENSAEVTPYTPLTPMKYPKPGYPNPFVSLHLFELDKHVSDVGSSRDERQSKHKDVETIELTWDGRRAGDDSILNEVAWIGNRTLIVKEVNRAATDGGVVFFDLASSSFASGKGRPVRRLGKDGEQADEGWIDAEQTIYPLGGLNGYLDIVPTAEGYNHIALFSPPDSSAPRWLTTGEWEVDGGIKAVDLKRNLVYFSSTTATSSIDRQLYSVALPSSLSGLPAPSAKPTPLTDAKMPGYYTANFSPAAGYYLLGYNGPNVPWQKVVSVANKTFEYLLADNAELNVTSSKYQMPLITRTTIDSDGYELNAMEIRPPSMDDSGRTKYPVLFRVYGGPSSQMVTNRWERDWHHYLACSLKYVIVVVDGRGTGWKGRKLRNPVKNNLGFWETTDQINAARIWATKRYVDSKRIGIWGWSYGGFMAAKVAEADAGIHSLAMSVAPVTSWRMYDSIYTERYMGLPQSNPGGYTNASISSVQGFKNVHYLLAHGSGDDNVHFANSAHLLDMLTQNQVRDYWFRMFTDSDHGIYKRNANRELFEWMTSFLLENWGKGGARRSG